MALLLQSPGDYFLHERVAEELPAESLRAAGLTHLAARHPRDLSGGERQRLALEIVLRGEPPRSSASTSRLAAWTGGTSGFSPSGSWSSRPGARRCWSPRTTPSSSRPGPGATLLLGDGRVVADAPTAEVLGGGWYFATQTARILGGEGGALLPEEGAEVLRAWLAEPVSA